MDKIKKTIRYNSLLKIYGNLLSKTQYAFADAYFSYDLSLSEIAEAHDVSRSAVEEAIKKALKKLDEYEKELKVLKNNEEIIIIYHLYDSFDTIFCTKRMWTVSRVPY